MFFNAFQSTIFPIRNTNDNDYDNNDIERILTPESPTALSIILELLPRGIKSQKRNQNIITKTNAAKIVNTIAQAQGANTSESYSINCLLVVPSKTNHKKVCNNLLKSL